MIGAIIGDTVGSIYEFENYKAKDCRQGQGICRMHTQPSRRNQGSAGDSSCDFHGTHRR